MNQLSGDELLRLNKFLSQYKPMEKSTSPTHPEENNTFFFGSNGYSNQPTFDQPPIQPPVSGQNITFILRDKKNWINVSIGIYNIIILILIATKIL